MLRSHSKTIVSIIHGTSHLNLLTILQNVTNKQLQYRQLRWVKKEWRQVREKFFKKKQVKLGMPKKGMETST